MWSKHKTGFSSGFSKWASSMAPLFLSFPPFRIADKYQPSSQISYEDSTFPFHKAIWNPVLMDTNKPSYIIIYLILNQKTFYAFPELS